LIIASTLLVAGCKGGLLHGSGTTISAAALQPLKTLNDNEDMLIGGTKISVSVEAKASGDEITVKINTHGEEIEEEKYVLNASELDLLRADTDEFTPPIRLLKFPASGNESWDWSGTSKEGTTGRSATAHVTSYPDKLVVGGVSKATLAVQVQFSISSGMASPAQRTLTFWFAEPGGLIKREFGAGTTRQPAESAG
jgi:hypothetical protein